jgi:hypothetical protein
MDALNGRLDRGIWGQYILPRQHNRIALRADMLVEELDHISLSDLDILGSVWDKFGVMTSSQLRRWTHDNCKEYILRENGRVPITLSQIGRALGIDGLELDANAEEYRRFESLLH